MKYALIFLMSATCCIIGNANSAAYGAEPQPETKNLANFERDSADAIAKIKAELQEFRLAKVYAQFGDAAQKRDPQLLQAAIDKAIHATPELRGNTAVMLYQAQVYALRNNYSDSYRDISKIIRRVEAAYSKHGIHPKDNTESENTFLADMYFIRGRAELGVGMFPEAIKDIDMAFSIQPRMHTLIHKCRALLMLKNYAESARVFETVFEKESALTEVGDRDILCRKFRENGQEIKACAPSKQTINPKTTPNNPQH